MKLKTIITILIVGLSQILHAQKKQASIDLYRSFAGTGDMKGIGFLVEYGKFINKKIEIAASLGADIHSSQLKILIAGQGDPIDASLRFVTAGVQLAGQLHVALWKTTKHELKIGAGPMIRYQASSLPDIYSIYTPVQTGIPEIVISFRQFEKQEIVSLGYLGSISYSFTFHNRFFIGGAASLQNDTNADIITQYGLKFGKRF